MHIRITLAAGLAIIAVALVVTLSRSPLTAVRGNSSTAHVLGGTRQPAHMCQAGEALPQGTAGIRLALFSVLGPNVTVQVLSGARVLTQGSHPAGWSSGTVTVPVRPLARAVAPVRVCFALSSMNGEVTFQGWRTGRAVAATSREGPLTGRIGIEYLRPGHPWWGSVIATIRRMGLGHAIAGFWNALLAAVLAVAVIGLSCGLVLRELS
jgi:hypothetical protein